MIELAERTDTRRITEADPDYQRLHGHWRRKLLASVKQYARELAASSPEHEHAVQGAFVRRHTRLLSQCYIDGHAEGQRDYWQAVSNKRHTPHDPDRSQLLRRLRFYTPSVVKMAIEGMAAWHETQRKRSHGLLSEVALAEHTGVMVAFFLDRETARKLALPGGEPVEDLHITLGFLGDNANLNGDLRALRRALATFASEAEPLEGTIAGYGRFTNVPDGEKTPVLALPDIPGLPEWRQRLEDAAQSVPGIGFDATHGYTPHITLAYIDADKPMPVQTVPDLKLRFDRLTLAVGGQRIMFKLGGPMSQEYAEGISLADTSSMDAWLAGINNRVLLQAEASWMGLQDGYVAEGGIDPASPYALLYWNLEPLAKHCEDCLQLAADSPYDPPGSGGHELNQTPGDGGTECGAACKCDLSYGYYDGHRDLGGPTGRGPVPNAPMAPAYQSALRVAPPAKDAPLSDNQAAALDLMRATHNAWQEYAADLPDLPQMFGGEIPEDMPAVDWTTLTRKQKQLYAQWLEALQMWQEAGGEG